MKLNPRDSNAINKIKLLKKTSFFQRCSEVIPKNKFLSLFYSTLLDTEDDEEYRSLFYPKSKLIKKLQKGEAFGEIALMRKQKRTATTETKNETIVLTLTKKGFDTLIDSYYKAKNIIKINFMCQYSFFNNIPFNK